MTNDEIEAAMTALHSALVEKLEAQPFFAPSLSFRSGETPWEISIYRDYNGGDYCLYKAKGEAIADAINAAFEFVNQMPAKSETAKRDWQKKLGELIDEGNDLSLPAEVIEPLRTGAKAMSHNLLTHEASA